MTHDSENSRRDSSRISSRGPSKDPLEGKTLEMILNELVAAYGWEEMGRRVRINCFRSDPSLSSSLKFLRRTPWARAEVEELYRDLLWEKNRMQSED